MINFLFKKFLNVFLALFGVVTIIFFLFNIIPSDPAQMMLGQIENKEQIKNIEKKFGFDLSIEKQYLYYLNDLSPVSIHTDDLKDFNYYDKNKYHGLVFFFNIWLFFNSKGSLLKNFLSKIRQTSF